jgi:hypothetical protein
MVERVSIIMATHNRARLLASALASGQRSLLRDFKIAMRPGSFRHARPFASLTEDP